MFYKKSKNRQPGSAFLDYLKAQILNIPQIGASHDGGFMGSVFVPAAQKFPGYVTSLMSQVEWRKLI